MALSRYVTIQPVPEPPCLRWTAGRKAGLVVAINAGKMTLPEAAERYGVDPGEIEDWSAKFAENRLDGLCTTKIQTVQRRPLYRPSYAHQGSGGR